MDTADTNRRKTPWPRLHCGLLAASLVLVLGPADQAPGPRAGPERSPEERRRLYLKNPLYKEIHAQYRKTDPSKLIGIDEPEDLAARRRALIRLVFGSEAIPAGLVARVSQRDLRERGLSGMAPLARLDALEHRMERGIGSSMYWFRAREPCGRLALYHEGHGESFTKRVPVIRRLLEAGYDVIGLDMPVTGLNPAPMVELEGVGRILLDSHAWFRFLDRPLRFFLEPVAAAVNFAAGRESYEEIVMIGLSGGGWTTTVYAAMDPRIRRSYPVAGSMPLYLRSSTPERTEKRLGDFEQLHPGLIRTANYLEMYVMGASGEGRRQLQVINQFDLTVPFRGVKHRTYLPAVQEAVARLGPGEFDVFLDTTVGAHAIHGESLLKIVDELRVGCREAGPVQAGAGEEADGGPD